MFFSKTKVRQEPNPDLVVQEFVPPAPLQTAVLFLVFNRPDTTTQVFEAIRKAKPPRLYVAADGAREGREGEAEKVAKTREIATAVDWPCEVKTLFRDKNLGCKYAVSEAITWFFEQEEQGIILEDDCLPSQSFFWFCEELLKKYANNKNIWMISGYNHFPNRIKGDYYYCKQPGIWGWASWRNRWLNYTSNPICYNSDYLDLPTNEMKHYWGHIFSEMDYIDTWDYQLAHLVMTNLGYCIRPGVNLIFNIGFGNNATHTTNTLKYNNYNAEMRDIKNLYAVNLLDSAHEDIYHFSRRFRRNITVKIVGYIRRKINAVFSR